MAAGETKRPQEALSEAMIKVANLRASLPCKAGRILVCIDEIVEALNQQDQGLFPFNALVPEIDALAGIIRTEYDDLNSKVDRTSSAYELVLSLDHRIRLSLEFMVTNKIFQSVEKRYERIDKVLPVRNYSLRDVLSQLHPGCIGISIQQKLQRAVNHFDEQQYKQALRECTEAGEALFTLYKRRVKCLGCDNIPSNQGAAVGYIRSWMSDPRNVDTERFPFAPTSRIERFLLTMFEALHYLRNAVFHPSEAEGERLPPWQCQRRADFPETPECARLGLCLSLQIVLELQALLDHAGTQDVT